MALLLPLLLLILFGIIIVGFMFYADIQVTNAAREGARAGSIYRLTQFDTGLDLDTTVQKAIYDNKGTVTLSDDVSSLGILPTTSSLYRVTCNISHRQADGTYLSPSTCKNVYMADIGSGDRMNIALTYSYTLPIVAVALPMFQQPVLLQGDVMMEIQ
jgi:Flp pilus assembly protein TadG